MLNTGGRKMKEMYDVLIIGGGVVGSAMAREMSRYRLKIGVLEKNLDVCNETSGRNSGVVHGGFAYDRGSLKAKLCVEGNKMMGDLAKELDFHFIRCGKVLVGNTEEDMETLKRTMEQGKDNGATNLELIDEKRLHELVPAVVGKFAMFSHNSGIVDPFGYTIALAENAHANGVEYHFGCEVTAIRREDDDTYEITTTKGNFKTRWVVNCAGLGCGKISDMLGITGYRIIGSKGDYIILDKRTGPLLPMPVYPVPSNTYMGIHVTNTTDGNVIIGPNADMVTDFTYYGVPQKNMDYLAEIYLHYQTIHIDELIGPKGKNQKNMRDLPPEEVYKYACEDADITLKLKNVLEEELKKQGVEHLFYEIEMPLVRVLANMESNGVRIDTETLKQTSEHFTVRLQEIEKEIYELAGETFNNAAGFSYPFR